MEKQIDYIEADPHGNLADVPELLDRTFDLVLLVGQIHRRSQQECQELFAQLHTLIKPELELVLVDVFPGQENGDSQRFIFELELGLRTSQGRMHDPKWLKESLNKAGFDQVQFAHLPSPPFYWGLVLSQRS